MKRPFATPMTQEGMYQDCIIAELIDGLHAILSIFSSSGVVWRAKSSLPLKYFKVSGPIAKGDTHTHNNFLRFIPHKTPSSHQDAVNA